MYLILSLGFFAFVFSLLITPAVRNAFLRMGVVDRPDGVRKIHILPVPRVGGIAIVLSYLTAFAVILLLPFSYRSAVQQALPDVWKLMLAASVVFATGLLDDLIGLRPWQKLCGQVLGAGMAYWGGVEIHLDSGNPWELWWSIPLTIVWLVGCTNAFNLIDGLDGLAAGVGLFGSITVLLAAFMQHNLPLALVTMPLVGCLLGFLRYNFNPASVFLGDCGSLLIGFLLGCFGALWSQKSATMLGMTAPLMAMAIPLLDVGLSVVRRFLRHQPIFGADRGHIHHRLLDRGFTPRGAALILYVLCGIGAAFSLMQNTSNNQFSGLIIVLFCVAAWIGIQNLGYTEFAAVRQLFWDGTFRKIIDGQTRLQQFEESIAKAETIEECWQAILMGGREFKFRGVRLFIQGVVYEDMELGARRTSTLQLRISLANSQYVNFYRDLSTDLNPVLLERFVNVAEAALNAKLSAFEAKTPASSITLASVPTKEEAFGILPAQPSRL